MVTKNLPGEKEQRADKSQPPARPSGAAQKSRQKPAPRKAQRSRARGGDDLRWHQVQQRAYACVHTALFTSLLMSVLAYAAGSRGGDDRCRHQAQG